MVWLAVAGIVLAAVVQALAPNHWPLELLTHFAPQYAVAGTIIAGSALSLGMRLAAVLAAAVTVFFAVDVWTIETAPGARAGEAAGPSVSVITFNMFDRNPRKDELRAWLMTRPADVVALQEAPATFAAALRDDGAYPYQSSLFDAGLDGAEFPEARAITVLSVFPVIDTFKLKRPPDGRAAALVRLAVSPAKDLWLAVVDAVEPPLTPQRTATRDRYLLSVAARVAHCPGPLMVAGDFNATPYAPVLKRFSSIADVRPTGLLDGTWPHWLGPLGLRLDHILVRGVVVEDVRVLVSRGSDHRPVRALLRLAE